MAVTIRTNPASDNEFRRRVEACFAAGAATPAELQQRLREDYPNAVVTDGIRDEFTERWYAYRDGRWTNADTGGHASPREALSV